MATDAATLHDLDVLSTSTQGGPTLLGLVDRTGSRAGRAALRRRLTIPARSADEILALQRAYQVFAAGRASYRALFDRSDPDAVERYLELTWQLPSARPPLARFVEGLSRPRWFRDYLRDVATGRRRVVELLRAARELAGMIAESDAVILRDAAAGMRTLLAAPQLRQLLDVGSDGSTSGQVAFDEGARNAARPLLLDLIERLGSLEAMWSFGAVADERGWCYPRPAVQFRVAGLVHPFLGRDAVGNDLELTHATRLCFVTGPNMAGKSTFLKAAAVAMLLAHAGCGVRAASMEFPVVATIFSSVQIADNLSAHESFYLAEVRRIKSLALALHDEGPGLAVLDEPFRGTNVHDAAEATVAVISRLASHPSALVFIASHLAEVVPSIADDPRVRLLHFSADVSGDAPAFDYQLRDGLSTQRLGMTLLRQEGVLDLLDSSAGPGNADS